MFFDTKELEVDHGGGGDHQYISRLSSCFGEAPVADTKKAALEDTHAPNLGGFQTSDLYLFLVTQNEMVKAPVCWGAEGWEFVFFSLKSVSFF